MYRAECEYESAFLLGLRPFGNIVLPFVLQDTVGF